MMESLNNMKNRFVSLKKQAETELYTGNYAAAKKTLEEASNLLGQIYVRDTNQKNRQDYLAVKDSLQSRYNECKEKLGEAKAVSANISSPKPGMVRPNVGPKPGSNAPQKSAKPGEKIAEGEIQYVFNNIDVKQFLADTPRKKILFSDVIGMDDEKKIIAQELFIDDEQKAYKESIGLENKNFILLYGLPGTGKTYFAMALSNELNLFAGKETPFFSVVCTQLKEAAVGKTENNIIALFEFTKQFERCVLFMDEFDAIGQSRTMNSGDPTAIPVVNTLLTQLSGFASNPNLLFLAATNCPYNLDGALLSRAALRIEVPLPSAEVLEMSLRRKIGNLVSEEVDLSSLADALERGKFSNRDCDSLIQAILSEHYEAHSLNPDINYIDKSMIKAALSRVHSSIKIDEEAKLDAFRHQTI